MNAKIFEKANQIIKTCDTAYLGVIDENDCPNVSAVSLVKPGEGGIIITLSALLDSV